MEGEKLKRRKSNKDFGPNEKKRKPGDKMRITKDDQALANNTLQTQVICQIMEGEKLKRRKSNKDFGPNEKKRKPGDKMRITKDDQALANNTLQTHDGESSFHTRQKIDDEDAVAVDGNNAAVIDGDHVSIATSHTSKTVAAGKIYATNKNKSKQCNTKELIPETVNCVTSVETTYTKTYNTRSSLKMQNLKDKVKGKESPLKDGTSTASDESDIEEITLDIMDSDKVNSDSNVGTAVEDSRCLKTSTDETELSSSKVHSLAKQRKDLQCICTSKQQSSNVNRKPDDVKQSTPVTTDNTEISNKSSNHDKEQEQCNQCLPVKSSFKSKNQTSPSKTDIKNRYRRKYVCNKCEDPFSNEDQLAKHIRCFHNTPEGLEDDTKLTVRENKTTVAAVFGTTITVRVGKKKDSCQFCGNYYATTKGLKEHISIHCLKVPYKCKECGRGLQEENQKHVHLKYKKKEKKIRKLDVGVLPKYECGRCSMKFFYEETFTNHASMCGEKVTDNKDRVVCELCHKSYHREYLKQHMLCHRNEKSFTCPECDKRFNTANQLRTHSLLHQKVFACKYCQTTFTQKASLKMHQNVLIGKCKSDVESQVRFECKVCNRLFSNWKRLAQHQLSHKDGSQQFLDSRPFLCDKCSKSFKCQPDLTRHYRVHTKEKPHKCLYCDSAFAQKCNLDAHMRIHTKDQPFMCHICKKRFTQQSSCKQHIQSQHKGEYEKNVNKSVRKTENVETVNIYVSDLIHAKIVNKSVDDHSEYEKNDTDNVETVNKCDSGTCSVKVVNKYDSGNCSVEAVNKCDGDTSLVEAVNKCDSGTCSVEAVSKCDGDTSSVGAVNKCDGDTISVDTVNKCDGDTSSVDIVNKWDSDISSVEAVNKCDGDTSSVDTVNKCDGDTSSVDIVNKWDSDTNSADIVNKCDSDTVSKCDGNTSSVDNVSKYDVDTSSVDTVS